MNDPTSFELTVSLSEKHLKAIGRVMSHWSYLEWMAGQAVGDLLDLSVEEANAVTSQMNLRPKLELFSLLFPGRCLHKDIINESSKIISEITNAQEKRRLLAHGVWAKDHEGQTRLLKFYGGKNQINRINFMPVLMTEEELEKIVNQVCGIALLFPCWWQEKGRPSLIPSPYKPY
ncbi:MAG: hypothetical protein AB7H77_01345 [Bdellovibrionales bacterium]